MFVPEEYTDTVILLHVVINLSCYRVLYVCVLIVSSLALYQVVFII